MTLWAFKKPHKTHMGLLTLLAINRLLNVNGMN